MVVDLLHGFVTPENWDSKIMCKKSENYNQHFCGLCAVLCKLVRPSGRGTVHSRPHKIFLHFHDLLALLNKIREGVALSPLSILHKTH